MSAPSSYDFTVPGTFPRSGRDLVGGAAYLGRAIDKVRADLAGTVGEYIAACPQSRRVYDLYGVGTDQFREAVRTSATDEDFLHSLTSIAPKHPDEAEVARFNADMLTAGPGEAGPAWFKETLAEIGKADRTDIRTFVDLQDLEEGRDVPRTTASAIS